VRVREAGLGRWDKVGSGSGGWWDDALVAVAADSGVLVLKWHGGSRVSWASRTSRLVAFSFSSIRCE